MEHVDQLVARLRVASVKEREPLKEALLALARGPDGASVRDHLEGVRRGELLEVQWELEEVLEATAPKKPEAAKPIPPPPPPSPPPEEKPDPNRQLSAKDLVVVYDDPRGLVLHKTKVGDRWFATQFDPRSGQPMTFELSPAEVEQVKKQFAGSPYWVVGSGVTPPPKAPPKAPLKPGGAR